jgi:hypothetical protein
MNVEIGNILRTVAMYREAIRLAVLARDDLPTNKKLASDLPSSLLIIYITN